MRKLAFRYRRVKEMYNTYKNNVGGEWAGRGPSTVVTGLSVLEPHPHQGRRTEYGHRHSRHSRPPLCARHCSERAADISSLSAILMLPPEEVLVCHHRLCEGRKLRSRGSILPKVTEPTPRLTHSHCFSECGPRRRQRGHHLEVLELQVSGPAPTRGAGSSGVGPAIGVCHPLQ